MTRQRQRKLAAVLVLMLALTFAAAGVASAQETDEVDDRAHISFIVPIIDENGQLWFKLGFYVPWGDEPPQDIFSLFFSLHVQLNGEESTVGWETHAGEERVLAEGAASGATQLYITGDGCVLVATGLFPTEPFTATVNASWASWADEATTQAVSGGEQFSVDSGSAERGDPVTILGSVVFDLANRETVSLTALPATTSNTTTTTATTVTTATTATTVTTATTLPSTTEVTLPGGGNTEGGSLGVWVPIVIFGLVVGGFWVYFRTREHGSELPGTDEEEDDDDGDDPRDTPPPVVYGEQLEYPECGWALYWIDGAGNEILLSDPPMHVCCKYFVFVKTIADSEVAKQSRQDGTTERLRIYDAGRDLSDVRLEARAGARSGPSGRQDWIQGLGDPLDQSGNEPEPFRQVQPGETLPDVAARVRHTEKTVIGVTLFAKCPEFDHAYALTGESDMQVMATHECTNDAGDPCPIELSATGTILGAIEGPSHFGTSVTHTLGGTPDDLDRDESSRDDRSAYTPRAGHDHAEKDRGAHEVSAHDQSSEAVEDHHINITVTNDVQLDASQIVPEEAWGTTERVTAHLETLLTHEVEIEATLKPKACEANGCCGHGKCGCDANFVVTLSRFGSSVVVDGRAHQIVRKPKPAGVDEDETWDLVPAK